MSKIRLCAIGLLAGVVCLAQEITEYPTPNGRPTSITAGPDGNLWLASEGSDQIIRVTVAGVVTGFTLSPGGPGDSLTDITTGPDGNLWFTVFNETVLPYTLYIGRITPTGVVTKFPTDTAARGITAGPDGNLWFTSNDYIGRITPTGVITKFPVPDSDSRGITTGPDGNLWFTEFGTDRIGRITVAGVITEFPVLASFRSGVSKITAGPDGNLWFTELFANRIGRITPAGVVTEFSIPSSSGGPSMPTSWPLWITAGPDGNLWFTEYRTNKIGKITPAGLITEFPIPTANSLPYGIATGADGNLWFSEFGAYQVGKIHIPYDFCLLYDPTKAVKSGSTIPIKLQLCSGGNDLSSSNITLHAVSVTQISTSISGAVQDSGNANPDNDFRFDSTLGTTGGYIFNLSTKGLTTGTYNLNFTMTGSSFVNAASFQVK